MFHLRLCLLLAVVMLSACPAFAQRDRDTYTSGVSIEISGEVRLADNNQPARGVTVRLERFSGGILDQIATDGQGRFRFSSLQRGYYTIIIKAQGFATAQQQADLQVLTRAYLIFELKPDVRTSAPASSSAVLDARVPSDAQDEMTKGRVALQEKNVKEALQHFEKAVQLFPSYYEAQLVLGNTYMEEREWEKAETALRHALELKPQSTAARIALGEVYRRQKRYAEAAKVLQEALKLDDESWQGHFTLGRVFWEMNEVARSGTHIGRTLQLKPDFAEAHLLAGNILLRVGQPERALVEYQEYLRLEPKGDFTAQAQEMVRKIKKAMAERKK